MVRNGRTMAGKGQWIYEDIIFLKRVLQKNRKTAPDKVPLLLLP